MTQIITKSVTGTDDAIAHYEASTRRAAEQAGRAAGLLFIAIDEPDTFDRALAALKEAMTRAADAATKHTIVIDESTHEIVADSSEPTLAELSNIEYCGWFNQAHKRGQLVEGRIRHALGDEPRLGALCDEVATGHRFEVVGFGSLIGTSGRSYIGLDNDAHVIVRAMRADEVDEREDSDRADRTYAVRIGEGADTSEEPEPTTRNDDANGRTAKQPKCKDGTWRGHDWRDIGESSDESGRTIGRDKCNKCDCLRHSTIDPQFGWTRYEYEMGAGAAAKVDISAHLAMLDIPADGSTISEAS